MSDTYIRSQAIRTLLWACIEDYPNLWDLASELRGIGFGTEYAQEPLSFEIPRMMSDNLVVPGFWVDGIGFCALTAEETSTSTFHVPKDPPFESEKVVLFSATESGRAAYERIMTELGY